MRVAVDYGSFADRDSYSERTMARVWLFFGNIEKAEATNPYVRL